MAWWGSAWRAQHVFKAFKARTGTAHRICEISLNIRNVKKKRHVARLLLSILVLTYATSSVAAPEDFNHRKLAETAKTKFIVPSYKNFNNALIELRAALSQLCISSGQNALLSARAAYSNTISAWGSAEIIKFGPVVEKNRYERIFYWPDRKGRGRRQVLKLLRSRDENALLPATLSKKSVAVQGLTALEIVLFGNALQTPQDAKDQYDYSCKYAVSIAENLLSINASVLEEWTSKEGFVRLWSNPEPSNPIYLSGMETTLELVNTLDVGLETVTDRRIAPIVGMRPKRRKSRPILWQSNLSATILHANISALHNLLFTWGISEAFIESQPYQTKRAEDYIFRIKNEFDISLDIAEQLLRHNDPFPNRLVDIPIANQLVTIAFHLAEVRFNNVPEIKRSAGLVVGFNASDGD